MKVLNQKINYLKSLKLTSEGVKIWRSRSWHYAMVMPYNMRQ
jgi:hypothetical protein